MPWEARPVSDLRRAFVHLVRTCHVPVAEACRRFGVSRKTGYKWLARFDADRDDPLGDRRRAPHGSPARTSPDAERLIRDARGRFGWGARKLHAHLRAAGHDGIPSVRTVHQVLRRHGLLGPAPRPTPAPPLRFERPACHDLWQADHKGPLEVGRVPVYPLAILDDHSRYCLALHACCPDRTMATAWEVFWAAFGEFGLPREVLTDNAFGSTHAPLRTTPSWFDARLIRLGVAPAHGRAYHPQTQGKVERFNGTLERELLARLPPGTLADPAGFRGHAAAWRDRYNHLRPHEALGDRPPASRFTPSPRPRPATLPDAEGYYPAGSVLRTVGQVGDVRFRGCRILAGRGLVGEVVRVEERERELLVFYCWKPIRTLPVDALLNRGIML